MRKLRGGSKNGGLYSFLVPLLSSSASATSSPPSMPLPLCLGGRMMMNRLAARKQNISSQGRFGNWLSTSAEPWPHNHFEPVRTWFIKQPLINALLSGQGRLKTQRPDHSNMNSTCTKKNDRSTCVCLADGIVRSQGVSTAVKGNCGRFSPVKSARQ